MKRALLVIAIVAAVLLGSAAVALKILLSPEHLSREVAKVASRATGLDVQVEDASLSFVPLGISLGGLSFRDEGAPLLEVESGLARLDWRELLSRRVLIRTFEIRGASFTAPPADGGEDVSIGGVEVRGTLQADAAGGDVRSEGRVLLGAVTVSSAPELGTNLARIEPVVHYRVGYAAADGRLSIETLRLEAQDLRLEADGEVTGLPDGPRIRLTLPPTDVSVDGLLKLTPAGALPDGVAAGGTLKVDASLEGPLADPQETPRLSWTLSSQDLRMNTADGELIRELRCVVHGEQRTATFDSLRAIIAPEGTLEGAGRFADGTLTLTRVRGALGGSDFDGSGTVTGLPDSTALHLSGKSRRLDLVELATLTPAGASTSAAGASASDPPPLVPSFPPFPTRLELEIDSLLTEGTAMADVSLDAQGAGDSGKITLTFREADCSGVMLQEFATTIDVEGQTARGEFRAPRVGAYHVPLTDVAGKLELGVDRLLRVTDATGRAFGGTVEGTADVDLTDPESPAFDIRTQARGVDANQIVSTMTRARDVLQGTLDVSSSFSGRGATPEQITQALTGNGKVTARDGSLARTPTTTSIWKALDLPEESAIPFRELITAFSVRDGRLLTDRLTLDGAGARWTAGGSVSFAGDLQYALEVELTGSLAARYRQRLGDAARLFENEEGKLVFHLEVSGPASRPSVTLDRSALARKVRDQVGDAVRDKVGTGLRNLLGKGAKSDSGSGGR